MGEQCTYRSLARNNQSPGFCDTVRNTLKVPRKDCAKVDQLATDALLFRHFACLLPPLTQTNIYGRQYRLVPHTTRPHLVQDVNLLAPAHNGDISPLANDFCLTQRDGVVFHGNLGNRGSVECLWLHKDYGVGITHSRQEQALRGNRITTQNNLHAFASRQTW